MSAKTARNVTRSEAIALLLAEIGTLSNEHLERLLNETAESGEARSLSYFDNFTVSAD